MVVEQINPNAEETQQEEREETDKKEPLKPFTLESILFKLACYRIPARGQCA